jgi:SOS-response transcriptional repressor LexA
MLMKHYGLNKNSLTVKVGLPSNSVIGRIVNEQSNPSFEVLEKIMLAFKQVNARWLVTNEGSMLGQETASVTEKGEIKYLKAGSGEPFPADTVNVKATAILTLYGFVDCQYAFDVFGDSMAPRFRSGDVVLCSDEKGKPVNVGEAYYMVINDNPSIRIIKNVTSTTYKLSAENSRIEDYEVSKSNVTYIYQIKGVIRREVF